MYTSDYFPEVRPIAAMKARLWISQGRWTEAEAWVREQGVSVDDELSYVREFEHITLARLLLARSERDGADPAVSAALSLLERLLEAAERGGRGRSVIEILVLQVLARRISGDVAGAMTRLERALVLAEPEGYVRIFVDEGPALAGLIKESARTVALRSYAESLLAAFGAGEHRAPHQRGLTEPLSERELDVLRLLATDLDGPEIARHLFVSPNTMRTHTRNIFAKLGVNSRRAAVRRATELELLRSVGR